MTTRWCQLPRAFVDEIGPSFLFDPHQIKFLVNNDYLKCFSMGMCIDLNLQQIQQKNELQ